MRITFISQARFPTEKAHGHQIAEVCAALERNGHDVTILSPEIRNALKESAHGYYGFSGKLGVEKLRVFDALSKWWVPGNFAFSFTMRSYGKALKKWLAQHPTDLLYTRSPRLLKSLLQTDIPVVLELHTLPRRSRLFIHRCNACRLVVCLTEPMRTHLISWGVEASQVIVEGDGVDLQRFEKMPESVSAKAEWKVPVDRPVIGYVGSLVTRGTMEKGVKELIEAVALLKEKIVGQERSFPTIFSAYLWIIGGPRDAISRYRRLAEKKGLTKEDIRFEGPIKSDRVPSALAACDVCVYPAPASKHAFFQRDTSPLKVFEYLAAGKPTVCADIPPLRGVIDPSLVHHCRPAPLVGGRLLRASDDNARRAPRPSVGTERPVQRWHSFRPS